MSVQHAMEQSAKAAGRRGLRDLEANSELKCGQADLLRVHEALRDIGLSQYMRASTKTKATSLKLRDYYDSGSVVLIFICVYTVSVAEMGSLCFHMLPVTVDVGMNAPTATTLQHSQARFQSQESAAADIFS